MQVNSIGAGLININDQQSAKPVKQSTFDTYLDKAMNLWNDTNQLQKDAEKLSSDFMLGKTDDIASVMIAQEKANVALQFTVKVRDTLLDAYNEIMRMQI